MQIKATKEQPPLSAYKLKKLYIVNYNHITHYFAYSLKHLLNTIIIQHIIKSKSDK